MACLYCGAHFSSKWNEENLRYGVYHNSNNTVHFGWDKKQPDLDYDHMLAEFWRYLHEQDRYKHIRQYQIAGGEPFHQVELEDSINFWDTHPNPDLTFNFITNLKVPHKKFVTTIDRLGRMVSEKKLLRVQISASLDCWGPQQEYARWGLDLNEWEENFTYLLDKPWVQLCINSAINALSINTTDELIKRMNIWNDRITHHGKIAYSFMTVMTPHWMDPAIFGPGVFDNGFRDILFQMRETNPTERSTKEHMQGIAKQIANSQRNVPLILGLIDYLTEIDRRRGTNWRGLFPWLDRKWD